MSAASDKTSQESSLQPLVEVPESLAGLPRLGFVRRTAASRAESAREDIIFGVDSLDELVLAAKRRFGNGKPPTP